MENEKKCCPVQCAISFIAVLVFLFAYDWLVHGHLLMADYQATASLWRPEAEMQALWPWCIAYHVALAAVITCFFKKFKKGMAACCPESCETRCPIKSGGVCFGMKVGLILALSHSVNYIWLAIPGDLAVKWFAAYLIQGIGAGAVLGIVSGGKGKGSCATTSCSTKA